MLKRAIVFSVVLTGLAALAASAPPPPAESEFDPGPVPACPVDRERELLIRDLSVVEDPCRTTWNDGQSCPDGSVGAWTFGKLFQGVAGTTDPATLSDSAMEWLTSWERELQVNGFPIPARPAIRDFVIDPWRAASGGNRLDMTKAPFRLLAIVNRVDLRKNVGTAGGDAGEARFVFGVVDLSDPGAAPLFTVILEYGIDASTCQDVKDWAKGWHDLGTVPFGPTFNARLQTITDRFTAIGASPSKPNGSALNQLRTDEIELDKNAGWELREFVLDGAGDPSNPAPLVATTVKQTPDFDTLDRSALLGDYMDEFADQILAGTYEIPLTYRGEPFRGARAPNHIDFWEGPVDAANNEVRHLLSINTCNACHGRETKTKFTQIDPRLPQERSVISGFLGGEDGAGIDVVDPVDPSVTRHFNDLRRRANDLCTLLAEPCGQLATETPLNRVH